jgi:hypothetical protein
LCSTHGYRGIALSGPMPTPPGIIQLGRAGAFQGVPILSRPVQLAAVNGPHQSVERLFGVSPAGYPRRASAAMKITRR